MLWPCALHGLTHISPGHAERYDYHENRDGGSWYTELHV